MLPIGTRSKARSVVPPQILLEPRFLSWHVFLDLSAGSEEFWVAARDLSQKAEQYMEDCRLKEQRCRCQPLGESDEGYYRRQAENWMVRPRPTEEFIVPALAVLTMPAPEKDNECARYLGLDGMHREFDEEMARLTSVAATSTWS